MAVADGGTHLTRGKIQDCPIIPGVQVRTFGANNQFIEEITSVVDKMLVVQAGQIFYPEPWAESDQPGTLSYELL